MHGNLDNITFNIEETQKTKEGAKFKIDIKIPFEMGWIENVNFLLESDSETKVYKLDHVKNEDCVAYFSKEIEIPTKALYHYYFSIESIDNFYYFKKRNFTDNQTIKPEEKWQMSVNFEVPEWAQGAVMYQIFPDRFFKGRKEPLKPMPRRNIHKSWDEDVQAAGDKDGIWCNDFYGGDLKGIEEKLPYIKSLGVSIIYINPIVLSQSNHRYDAGDYEKIDPYLGNERDLINLCNAAHELGIKIVLDAVFNHTGNDSKYFNEFGTYNTTGAYQSKESPYFPFFRTHEVNGIIYFDYWWEYKDKVVCNGYSPEWINYICGIDGVIDKWFRCGIDGLRLDVADELTDEYIEAIRTAVKRNKKDGFILGEVWKNPWRELREYIKSGKGMDAVMNYHLIDALFRYYHYKEYKDINNLKDVLYQLSTEYPIQSLNSSMLFTSTHDMTRGINLHGCNEFNPHEEWGWNLIRENDRLYQKEFKLTKEQYESAKKTYKNYVFNLAFLPGNLSIFYGDEIGMQGLGNIACRRPMSWNDIDYDLLNFFKEIGNIRNAEQHLRKAEFSPIDVTDKYIMYERLSDTEDDLVIVSSTDRPIATPIPERYLKTREKYGLYNSNKNTIEPNGALVLKKVA